MNNSKEKAAEAGTLEPEGNMDIVRERLKLDQRRLKLDIEAHETSKQIEFEKILLEKSKERTAKLQLVLPVVISLFAIGLGIWTATLQYRLQYVQAVSSYNETRLELFKILTTKATDSAAVEQAYKEVFPNDFKTLEAERRAAQKPPDK